MKIAFVGEAVSGFGGMETVIKAVIHSFQQDAFAQCEVFFFCRNDKMDKGWLAGIDAAYSFSKVKISFIRRAIHIRNLKRWIDEHKPDLVICIDTPSCFLTSRAQQKCKHRFTILSWPHFSLDHKKHGDCVAWADYHLAISSGIKRQMEARDIAEETVHVIYNPVAPQSGTIPAPNADETATFLYVGRMKFEGQKRVKDLLDGLAQVKGKWHLHAIGDGSDFDKCKAYARKLNIDSNITWHGWQAQPWEVVRDRIEKVSALLLTSSFEGFGMVLLEAMAWGIPCISANCVAGPEDIIRQGVNGYLYPPGEMAEFVTLLQQVVDHRTSFQPDTIKQSINTFYTETYNRRMREAILSVLAALNTSIK
ncbi:lipopolysaccharide 1,6-galactosyltransferase [Kosakonia cowanii]|uniref:lipopolysaccharide 1,6-galactosyltransferase n=1 Tax=Kosakonia cowanii TaxID=208223 RepID=UPI0023F746D6|nr:lipopolysaccharide 1,6-galactosyltransferase [Kosakonia cowanii]MDF7758198.1 lipopolysaccharide 1,6-galactosyltransferase [Kosakonia cowanii]